MNHLNLKINLSERQAIALYYALLDALHLAESDGRDQDRREISDLLGKVERKCD